MSVTSQRSSATEIGVFRVVDVMCGIDILQIQEIKKIHAHTVVHRAPPYVRGLVNMRGHIVTLIDVGHRLGLDPTPLDRPTHAIIVSLRGDLVGLLVDEVNDVIAVESQDILPAPANLAGLEGHFFEAVARTNDGLIAVLDMNRIAGAAMAQSSSPN